MAPSTNTEEGQMVQIAMLLFAFPLGAANWSRRAAYATTGALFVVTSIVQAVTTPQRTEVAYWVVQAVTAVVAVALVNWGSTWGARRRARQIAA
jgi:hypothetical protein